MLARLCAAALAAILLSSTALAHSSPSSASLARAFPAPPVRAWAATVIDADTGKVLLAANAHTHLAIASTTKVMTAVLALEMGKLSDTITVPKSAFNYEWDATVMGLKPGQKVTLRDLLYGLMLPSGADAANTIAIHYAGSEARFVALMNKKAAQLGMRDTHYVTPHGLDAPGQYSSAYDLAVLGRYASTLRDLMTVTSAYSYTWRDRTLSNLNHVINWYPGADGLKPGFTNAAGMCQLLTAQRHGKRVIAAILHTPDMVIDARNLLNFGLNDFSWAQTELTGDSPSLIQTGSDRGGQFVYFPATGHYVRGRFWQAYLANGRAAVLGFPRTEPIQEGKALVQYFENGALAQNAQGKVTRLALGASSAPAVAATASLPTPRPREGTIVLGATSAPTRALPAATSTPAPRPTPTAGPPPAIDRVFSAFLKAHAKELGGPVTPSSAVGQYTIQVFRYGGLIYSSRTKATLRLPLGDRLLMARGYLPEYPGNVYPPGFASTSVLNAIHWLR